MKLAAIAFTFVFMTVAASARADAPTATPASGASRTEEASAHFQRGVEAFRDGAFDAALVHFKAAYAAAPNYRVLYNVGQTSLKLQDYAAAEAALERYLQEGGADLPADRRAAVTADVERIRGRIATVTITTNETDGEVLVDDAPRGRLPLLAPLRVNGGRRKIAVVPTGRPAVARVVEIPGGDTVTLALDVPRAEEATPTRAAAPPPPAESARPPAAETRSAPVGAFVVLGVGGAAAIASGVFGVLALGAKSDADAALSRFPGSRDALDEARSRMQSRALVADVLGAAAIVAGGVGVTWLLLGSDGPKGVSSTGVRLGPAGGALVGRF